MRNLGCLSPDLMLNATAPGHIQVLFGLKCVQTHPDSLSLDPVLHSRASSSSGKNLLTAEAVLPVQDVQHSQVD